jgi:hypothetical protein
MKINHYFKNKLGRGLRLLSGISASMLLFASMQTHAQSNSGIIKSDSHIGGYQIKCNGQSTGTLVAEPSFGTGPYTYQWNTGETTSVISDKPAGIYYVNVIDANNIALSDTFELMQPRPLEIEQKISDYSGFGVSAFGVSDGSIEVTPNGGTPPYEFQWNTGETSSMIKNLSAGAYEYVIIDANNCMTNGVVTLASPAALQINFTNIEGTTCFDKNDGKATLNISGGLGDYSVVWQNGNFSFSPNDLSSGYNAVRIYQHGTALLDTGVFISQANELDAQFILSQFNGFNVSCVDCYNGSIITNVVGGTAPYNYLWDDAAQSTTANLNNLNGGEYNVLITDAHGCKTSHKVKLTMPAPKDWSRLGNTNIDPNEFIGSTDNSTVVFKANNQEALLISNDTIKFEAKIRLSDIEIDTLFNEFDKLIGMDENGNLRSFERGEILPGPTLLPPGCNGCGCSPVLGWGKSSNIIGGVSIPLAGNDIVKCPIDGNVGIGTTVPEANSKLDIHGEIAVSGERLSVGYNGNVGIGISGADEKLQVFGGNFKVTCPWDYQNPVFFVDHAKKIAGIGTDEPRGKFEVKISKADHLSFGNIRSEESGWATTYIGFNANREDGGIWKTTGDASNSGGSVIYSNALGDLMFSNINGENIPNEVQTNDLGIKNGTKMTFTNNGILGIGVNPRNHWDLQNYKLVVDGNIKCKKVRVDLQNWGDYVFDSNYELMDLHSIEQYIAKNKHLPGMPSANEVEKEGIDLGEMVKMQQVKIEELTLLLIQLQKQLDLPSQKN